MAINAVLLAVIIMLGLSLSRVHVVLSLLIGALAGGLLAGLGITDTLNAFQEGIRNGAQIALSYALLGAFAVAIAHSGLPQSLAGAVIRRIDAAGTSGMIKYMLFAGLITMSCFSQNLIPIHIAFIPLLVPPLLLAFNRMQIDRRLIACLITFGLVTTYMFIPYGFGDIYLNQIMLKNVGEAGIDVANISVVKAMAIPALGMLIGLLVAVFISYRKPREYQQIAIDQQAHDAVVEGDALSKTAAGAQSQSKLKTLVALAAIVTAFVVQLYTDSLLLGSMFGFGVFMATGVVKWRDADGVFNDGIKLMAMIGFIMITAQGFAEVMKATEQIQPLVDGAASLFGGNKAMAAFIMLLIGLIVTMGIGSSFS
ncbi:MAG TPA: sodium:proton antiporter, partial [Psychrobacter sp.]|nr:sodium:proton antiporter [Psychrobacter sp.]